MSLIVDIEKKLDNFTLKVSFTAGDGITAVLGASGCGKSVTLKCIAGVATPDRGRIVLNDRVLFDSEKGINLSPQKRNVGYLFQNYALFPNMTVLGNILCSVRNATSSAEKKKKAEDVITRLHLDDVKHCPVTAISGGQMQRTALARILVNDAEIIMLDEPFSALDEHLRFAVENELAGVMKCIGKTVLLVSHNRDEVYRLSSRVAVMHDGVIEYSGSREDVFKNPRTLSGARLTGVKNIAPAVKDENGEIHVPGWGMNFRDWTASDAGKITAAGLRMNELKTVKVEGSSGRFYDFVIMSVTENLFNYVVELRRKDTADALILYWQVSVDVWHWNGQREISLFVADDSLMPLRGKCEWS